MTDTKTLDLEALAESGFSPGPWTTQEMVTGDWIFVGRNRPGPHKNLEDVVGSYEIKDYKQSALARARANAQLHAAAPALLQRAIELEAEVERLRALRPDLERMKELESDGFWRSCSGFHETNEGAETGYFPYDPVLKCYLGSGCSECGGIGAVWDDTDYADFHKFCREAEARTTLSGDGETE